LRISKFAKSSHIDRRHISRYAVLEHVGESATPSYLVRPIGRSSEHGLGKRLIGPGQENQELGISGSQLGIRKPGQWPRFIDRCTAVHASGKN